VRKFVIRIVGELSIWKLGYYKNQVVPGKVYRQTNAEITRLTDFYTQFLLPGNLCFDVGANRGDFTRAFLNCGARVVAIEPQPNCFGYLKFLFGNSVILVNKGLGEKEEEKEMHLSSDHTISSFSAEWIASVKATRFSAFSWNRTQQMQLTTLDLLIAQYGIPAFVKIDVEGYEPEVLKGLSKSIKLISFEYTVPEQTAKALFCLEKIASLSPRVECNYTLADTYAWALETWITPAEMNRHINSSAFLESGSGDIYVRQQA